MWSDVIAVSKADTSRYEDSSLFTGMLHNKAQQLASPCSEPSFQSTSAGSRKAPCWKAARGTGFCFPFPVCVSGLLTDGLADCAWLLSRSYYLCKLNPIWRFSVIKSAVCLQGLYCTPHVLGKRARQSDGWFTQPETAASFSHRDGVLLAVCAAT